MMLEKVGALPKSFATTKSFAISHYHYFCFSFIGYMTALRPILSQLQRVNQMLIKRLQLSTKGQHEFFNQVGS